MASQPNFLLGKGERLTSEVNLPRGGGAKNHAYTLAEAKERLSPLAKKAAGEILALPADACPNGEAVAVITLHPAYLAKSHHPDELLRVSGLRTVGSRAVKVTPKKTANKNPPQPAATAELFVAGKREDFERLAERIPSFGQGSAGSDDLIKIEDFRTIPPSQRVRGVPKGTGSPLMEVVIHAGAGNQSAEVLSAFENFLSRRGIKVDLGRRIDTGELSFIPVRIPAERIEDVASFSFLRVARPMPKLRELTPISAANGEDCPSFVCSLPNKPAIDPSIRIAVFDGGVPDLKAIQRWVRRCDLPGMADSVQTYELHGLAVTSALLFGPMKAGETASAPYGCIDHYRVLDVDTHREPEDQLYAVLRRIVKVLKETKYDFVNISIGPRVPLDDDEVHLWTSKLDEVLSHGETLATVAAGNTGESDAATGLNLIQPPADGVNVLSVGACDDMPILWSRAVYSSVGRLTSPGIRKPDGLAFGGVLPDRPFYALTVDNGLKSRGFQGTSFASPNALRTAVGVRAILGPSLMPLALRTLLLHNCEEHPMHSPAEVGWGRICTDVDYLVTCATGAVHVIYQDKLAPKKSLRFPVPVPATPLHGKVTICATLCIATDVDPEHKVNYTRSGVTINFRCDKDDIKEGSSVAPASPFFGEMPGMEEAELREDAYKWETARRARQTFDGEKLKNPVFDVSYVPRRGGRDTHQAKPIRYAMVISVIAPHLKDLYDGVWKRYRHQLEQLQPQIKLQLHNRPG